jgi:Uri superfamily endonuclease
VAVVPTSETTYQLLIDVPRNLRVTIGRLGTFAFRAGRYVYTGSAKRHLDARIARHLRQEKTLRWHVDYLLAARGVRVVGVRRSRRSECALNRATGGSIPVAGFGASDCRAGCGAHLKFLGRRPPPLAAVDHAAVAVADDHRHGNPGPDRLF